MSQDTIIKKHLKKTAVIQRDGKRVEVQHRELAFMALLQCALEKKNLKAILEVIAESKRLYGESDTTSGSGNHASSEMHDAEILRGFLTAFELGVPNPDADGSAFDLDAQEGFLTASGEGTEDWDNPSLPESEEDDDER